MKGGANTEKLERRNRKLKVEKKNLKVEGNKKKKS